MTDNISAEARSKLMSRVRGKHTNPEMYVRKTLWSLGFRYRLHTSGLPGRPDLTLAKYRLVVFVHGCFWHQHGCRKSRRPASNRSYWDFKLDENIARDSRNQHLLEDLGWTVVTVWECMLERDTERLLTMLRSAQDSRG